MHHCFWIIWESWVVLIALNNNCKLVHKWANDQEFIPLNMQTWEVRSQTLKPAIDCRHQYCHKLCCQLRILQTGASTAEGKNCLQHPASFLQNPLQTRGGGLEPKAQHCKPWCKKRSPTIPHAQTMREGGVP